MITIRPTQPEDRASLLRLALAEPLFSPQEAATVADLLADYLAYPDHNGYYFLSALDDERLVGFTCYGPTPLTRGTYSVYWLCVAPSGRRLGTGRGLMAQIEAEVRAADGRLIVLDTAGRPDYAPTRAFYEHIGYVRAATVPEYYAPGDDLVIYALALAPIAWIPEAKTKVELLDRSLRP